MDNDPTVLLQVCRNGNSHRQHGHVSPFLGKLGAVDWEWLEMIGARATDMLPFATGRTLVVGLAESSLLLAWILAHTLPESSDLCFTTREPTRYSHACLFEEPHSHAPQHFLPTRNGMVYERVVIFEDEITTGTTLSNILRTMQEWSSTFFLLALRDMRHAHVASHGSTFVWQQLTNTVVDLSTYQAENRFTREKKSSYRHNHTQFNPYQRDNDTYQNAIATLTHLWHTHQLGTLYAIGECVDVPLAFCCGVPLAQRPPFRHVTRSPWRVDNDAIFSRIELGDKQTRYYLYNWESSSSTTHAVILSDSNTTIVANDLYCFLHQQGVNVTLLEVPV